MDRQKIQAAATQPIALLLALACLASTAVSTERRWETITSFREVRQMLFLRDTLWAATSGGLLAITDPDSPGVAYDNLNGLGTTDITDIIEDAAGQLWVTGWGRLIRFSPQSSKQFLFETPEGPLRLHSIADDGDNLWVGTDSGLALFSKVNDDGQIERSYHLFGDLNPNPTVNDILVIGDSIGIATTSGLAVAEKINPKFLSQSSWTPFGLEDYPELGTEEIRRVVEYEGDIYIATDMGMFRLDRSVTDTLFTRLPAWLGTWVNDIKVIHDTLYFYYRYAVGTFADSRFDYPLQGGFPRSPHTGANTGAFRWVGFNGDGIFHDRDSSGWLAEYLYAGPPGNDVSDIAVDADRQITAGFSVRGSAQRNGERWEGVATVGWTADIVLDPLDRPWVATGGFGLWLIDEDTLINYDETNSSMRGIPGGPAWVDVRALAGNGRYIYAACRRAANGYPVAIGDFARIDDPSGWDSIGLADGLTNEYVSAVDCQGNWVAVGTDDAGVFTCFVGEDPFNHSLRSCRRFTGTDGLASDKVRAVEYSPSGDLWVGTSAGLSRWDLDRFATVFLPPGLSNVVTALEFDGRENLWIGTTGGLAYIDGVTGASLAYTTRNSGLVSDDIRNLTIDAATGDLYIATSGGISVLRSGVTQLTPVIENVLAYPNPFVIRSAADRLNFNYSRSGTVRIFTVAGELVAEFGVNAGWDGRNQKGQPVASGVYVFVLTDDAGGVGRGKILVARER